MYDRFGGTAESIPLIPLPRSAGDNGRMKTWSDSDIVRSRCCIVQCTNHRTGFQCMTASRTIIAYSRRLRPVSSWTFQPTSCPRRSNLFDDPSAYKSAVSNSIGSTTTLITILFTSLLCNEIQTVRANPQIHHDLPWIVLGSCLPIRFASVPERLRARLICPKAQIYPEFGNSNENWRLGSPQNNCISLGYL
jgi:hypothetical protein